MTRDYHQQEYGKCMAKMVSFVLADPAYNVLLVQYDENSTHVMLSANEMEAKGSFYVQMLITVAHDHVYCNGLEFEPWYQV